MIFDCVEFAPRFAGADLVGVQGGIDTPERSDRTCAESLARARAALRSPG